MNKKKHVLFVLPTLEPGGAEYLMVEISNYLQDEYVIYLLVLSGKGSITNQITLPKEHILFLDSPFYVLTFSGISLKTLWQTLSKISTLIKEYKIDVVIASLPIAHFLFRLTKLLFFNSFQLFNIHHSQQFKANSRSRWKKVFDKINNLFSLISDDLNIFVSKASYRDNISKLYYNESKTLIIRNGVHIDHKKTYTNPFNINANNEYKIVFAGRLVHEKGHLFFLEVLHRIIKTQKVDKNVAVYLIGDGPKREEISNFCTQNALNVYILGWYEKEILPNYFASADLVVVPSISEGFGMIAVEAILSGATILASDAGGLQEIVVDKINGFVFENQNSSDLESKLIKLINEGIKIEVETSIQYTKQEFSFESMIDKYRKVINNAT